MNDAKLTIEAQQTAEPKTNDQTKPNEKMTWETPRLEDVSEQVMAQPYIRFT